MKYYYKIEHYIPLEYYNDCGEKRDIGYKHIFLCLLHIGYTIMFLKVFIIIPNLLFSFRLLINFLIFNFIMNIIFIVFIIIMIIITRKIKFIKSLYKTYFIFHKKYNFKIRKTISTCIYKINFT